MKNPDKPTRSRREFLSTGLKAGAMLPLLGSALSAEAGQPFFHSKPAKKNLKILLLGGTSFLGPHQIAYAIDRGHEITTFTRGKTRPTIHKEYFDKVESLIGDRKDNLEALKGRKWDAVIDNSGHRVQWTRDTAQLLKDNVELYLYTSSTGVYYPYKGKDIKEDTQLVLKTPEGVSEDAKYEYDYGVMKANSEIEARKAFGAERTIVVRPTYLIGPADRYDRFVHWPVRLAREGRSWFPAKPVTGCNLSMCGTQPPL